MWRIRSRSLRTFGAPPGDPARTAGVGSANQHSDFTRVAAVVVAVCTVVLFSGLALKAQCLNARGDEARASFGPFCYNDIQPLYTHRSLEAEFPYLTGELARGELVGATLEYPVLTGLFMWVPTLVADNAAEYFKITVWLLFPFGLLSSYLLALMASWRALILAAAPALAFYAFHNWDLLVVAATLAGFYQWQRGRYLGAAGAFGIGIALKLYPALFLVALAVERLAQGDRRRTLGVLAAGFGIFALVNLPFAVLNFDGWIATYTFHSERLPNLDHMWSWLSPNMSFRSDSSVIVINRVTTLLLVTSFGVITVAALRRRDAAGFPFVQLCAALLAAFLLWNKVHSPQYTLWLLPFFALLDLRWMWWSAYWVVDAVVYVGVFGWFRQLEEIGDAVTWSLPKTLMVSGAWLRSALLLLLVIQFLRSRETLKITSESRSDRDLAPVSARDLAPEPVAR